MKEIKARDQVRLGMQRCWRLAITGMSYRMFRSGVTVAILALAVAFLTHMLGFGILERETQSSAATELEQSRRLGQTITRLATPDARATLLEELAAGDDARLSEYQHFAGVDRAALEVVRKVALRYLAAASYLDDLPPAPRAVVLGDFKARELLDSLSTPEAVQKLAAKLRSLGHHAPGGDADFARLMNEERPPLDALLAKIESGHRAAVQAVADAFPGRAAADLAANPPPEFQSVTRDAGFVIRDQSALRAFARRSHDMSSLERALLAAETRAQVARDSGIAPGEVGLPAMLEYVGGSETKAAWLAGALRAGGAAKELSGTRVAELLKLAARERELEQASSGYVKVEGGLFGLSERSQWLILLSFLVCAVGVANAMLMSVTERFTEIATMKCLGAMDGFVMMMFVFEAVIQGALGGAVGVVLGVILAGLRAAVEYGRLAGSALSASAELGAAALLSLGVGVLLAAVAAVGPSFVAARLAPMEAMRVD